jgi:uncharacterized OB-fold protein
MTQTKDQIPIAPGLFEWMGEPPSLIGSKCIECREVAFPSNTFCPRCCKETTERIRLSSRGHLYSFTIQRFKPPAPYRGAKEFHQYGVGMIELPEGIRITSILDESDPSKLFVGMEMELIITKCFEDDDGREVLAYKFKAAGVGPNPKKAE